MSNNKSRLKETDFSRINLRDVYITEYPEYAAALRDEALFSNYGIEAIVKVPKIENNVDEYSNFVDDDFEISIESVVPKFEQYRQNVSAEGMAADGTQGLYPLEVLIPTKLHLPKNSRIVLIEYNSHEEKIAREWTVLSTEMKQLSGSKTYTRVANCVPSRQTIHHTSEFDQEAGIFYFNIFEVYGYKTRDLRANGCLYFNIHPVSISGKTAYGEIQENYEGIGEEIQEVPAHDVIPEYQENFIDEEYEILKPLRITGDGVASFVVKSTAISVLY